MAQLLKIMDATLDKLKTLKDFETVAINSSLRNHAKLYFSAGAKSSTVPRNNEEAFQRYRIVPRVLRDVSTVNLKRNIFNSEVQFPIGASPIGIQFLAHSDAELATARGCAFEEVIFIQSIVSSRRIEDVVSSVRNIPAAKPALWLQLYIFRDRSLTLNLLSRAEHSGFSAIVVTVDSPVPGLWKQMMAENFTSTVKDRLFNLPCSCQELLDDSLTFEDLKWLKTKTNLPIIVKGILTADDAIKAAECGASAIYVSNHGERQIERVVSTIDCLSEIVNAVKGTGTKVFLDGGIRSGTDIFVAIALGATAVFVGRPTIWGLAVEGEKGIRKVLQILKQEFITTMKLAGVSSIEDINQTMIRKN